MIEKSEFVRIFEELREIHKDDISVKIYNTLSACGNPCTRVWIYDICDACRQQVIVEFEYPLDCVGLTATDLVNKIYDRLNSHFHMNMKAKGLGLLKRRTDLYIPQLIQSKNTEEIMSTKTTSKFELTTSNTFTVTEDYIERLKRYSNSYFGIKPNRSSIYDYTQFINWRFYVRMIDRVIFNDPATIILWKSGEKTVVKCGPNETFDKEKGLAMALCKYFLGNKGNFNEFFKKFMEEEK